MSALELSKDYINKIYSQARKSRLSTKKQKDNLSEIKARLSDSVVFDISALEVDSNLYENHIANESVKLPFENIFFIRDHGNGYINAFLTYYSSEEERFVFLSFAGSDRNVITTFQIFSPSIGTKQWESSVIESMDKDFYRSIKGEGFDYGVIDDAHNIGQSTIAYKAANALSAIYCINNKLAIEVEIKEKHRIKKGKKKNTLKICTSKKIILDVSKINEYVKSKGTTGETKAAHIRRGHWRQYKTGRKSWVRSCEVGDISSGFTKKEYSIIDKD